MKDCFAGFDGLGGGLYATAAGQIVLEDTAIDNNVSSFGGGAYLDTGARLAAVRSTFSHNITANGFEPAGAGAIGNHGSCVLDSCVFEYNGGINTWGTRSSLVLRGCTFRNNLSDYESPGVEAYGYRDTFIISDCVFVNNSGWRSTVTSASSQGRGQVTGNTFAFNETNGDPILWLYGPPYTVARNIVAFNRGIGYDGVAQRIDRLCFRATCPRREPCQFTATPCGTPRRQVRGVQPLAPHQRAQLAGLRAAVGFAQHPQLLSSGEPPPRRLHYPLGLDRHLRGSHAGRHHWFQTRPLH